MSNRRMALAGVVAILIGVLVWWISGAVRAKASATATPATSEATVWVPRRDVAPVVADPVGDLRLEGQVTDEQEQPVGGATVVLGANPLRIVVSEQDGSFAFDGLVARTYQIGASRDVARAEPQQVGLTADTEPVILRMHAGLTLVVTVIDREARAPIAGATVTTGDLLQQTATTDAQGRAELRGLGSWFNVIEASADGYVPGTDGFELPEDPGGRFEHTIELGRGASVSGVVLDPDGHGMPGTTVSGTPMSGNADVHADTGPDGTWTIAAVSAGAWVFRSPGEQYAPGSSELVPIDGTTPVTGVVIRLQAGARIAGVVVDATGAPVAGAAVVVVSAAGFPVREIAGADGRFEVLGLPRERYTVVASEGTRSSARIEVDVRTADRDDLRVAIRDAMISGVVVDATGEPVAEASVGASATGAFLPEDGATITDAAGRWTVGPLSSARYTMSASARHDATIDAVTAKPGDRDVRLVVRPLATIRARVVRAGVPVARFGFAVSTGTGATAFATPTIVARSDAQLERSGLRPGVYVLTIAGADFPTKIVTEIEVSAGEVKDLGAIEIDAGRVVRGVVVDAAGAPVTGATVAIARFFVPSQGGIGLDEDPIKDALMGAHAASSGADGRFEIVGVDAAPERPLWLLADKPGVGRSNQLALADGDASVTLTLVETGAITVTILDAPISESLEASARLVGGAQPSGYAYLGGNVGQIDGLVPGTYEVWAEATGTFTRRSLSTTIEVRAGEPANATVRFLTDGITVVVTPGVACTYLSLSLPGERYWYAMERCAEDAPVELEDIAPGDYQACADQTCQPITVNPSPHRQWFTLP